MARAGVGGGSRGGGFSGGGHTASGHSGGGHRAAPPGGTTRAGARTGSRASGGGAPRFGPVGGFGMYNASRRSAGPVIVNTGSSFGRPSLFGCSGCLGGLVVIVVLIVIFALLAMPASGGSGSADIPASSYNREKLTDIEWSSNCVVDETGWIEDDGSISSLERKLRTFYDKTGVQPYVYLVGYREDLVSSADKELFASEYYENSIGNDYTFAFFYFEEADPDEVGYMYYEGGSRALSVMDAEAVDIFWAICDSEWFNGEISTEDAIANTFNKTAKRIMTRTRTLKDIIWLILIIVLVAVIVAAIIIIMNKRRKQEKERNEETRRILETPLE